MEEKVEGKIAEDESKKSRAKAKRLASVGKVDGLDQAINKNDFEEPHVLSCHGICDGVPIRPAFPPVEGEHREGRRISWPQNTE
jgi:hypothetical protein